jgi:hypothetical protein
MSVLKRRNERKIKDLEKISLDLEVEEELRVQLGC